MKSVTVKTPEGQLIIKVKRTKTGVDIKALDDICPLLVTCVMDDNSRIKTIVERK